MTRTQLEHILRAAGAIADETEIVVVGSQAILGSAPDAPGQLLRSMEADVYPPAAPEKADLIDGAIGEGSPFHDTFGYYAHGVGPETATLAADWRDRAVTIEGPATAGVRGICPAVPDLLVAKLAAGREKDFEFVATALRTGLAAAAAVRAIAETLAEPLRASLLARLERCERS